MEIGLIGAPVIGAIIGYLTNYVAVKMLFRPYNEKIIGNFKVPFTPGIIPKGQPRIARAVAGTVGETLLTEEDLKKKLLGEDLKEAVWQRCQGKLDQLSENSLSLKEFVTASGISENPDSLKEQATNMLCGRIMNKVYSMNLAKVAAEKILEAGGQLLQGSFIGNFIGPSVLNQWAGPIEAKIDEMIVTEGYPLISQQVSQEIDQLGDKTIGQIVTDLEKSQINVRNVVMNLYQKLVESGLSDILHKIDIKQIVEDKVNSMDPRQLEQLTFAVMKKELNAIINLGALIGFVLGCINILFLI